MVRHGLAALERDTGLRDAIRLEQQVVSFLDRLRDQYGADSMLRFVVSPEQPDPNVRVVQRSRGRLLEVPLEGAAAYVRYVGETAFLDLVDLSTGAGIRSAYEANVPEGGADTHLPLRALNLYRRVSPIAEPTKSVANGRTLMRFLLEQGTIGLILNEQGRAQLSPHDQRAEQFRDRTEPS